jgi:hypothetical protein
MAEATETRSAAIERIHREREVLAKNLNELESLVRQEPKRWFLDNLPRIMAGAFGTSALLGFMVANRRVQRLPRR